MAIIDVNDLNLDEFVRPGAPEQCKGAIDGLLNMCVAQAAREASVVKAMQDIPSLAALGVDGDTGVRTALQGKALSQGQNLC